MAVREGLLVLLRDGPRYGYQLKTEFEAATGGVWTINVGQVYTTLERLNRDGLVTLDERDEQKLYSITLAGVEELGAWWDAVPTEDPPPRDELMLKMLMAIEHSAEHGLDVITKHRTALTSLLQRRRRAASGSGSSNGDGSDAGEGLAAALVADALIVRAEADLRWLDLCEARLLAAKRRSTHTSTGTGTSRSKHHSNDTTATSGQKAAT
ncbi:MAG: PadR family transcriptional regulator [Ilumatobacter sp.]|uniref:PadR family transcriptional regulator n=1 Tax=Ilumatobacter sp. TaxID=1967498 RepID=UPI0039187B53